MERELALADSMASDRNMMHTRIYLGSPPEGKDLHPACLIWYCLYNWSCYNAAHMGSGYGQKRDGVC
jgi:hypothetical protein